MCVNPNMAAHLAPRLMMGEVAYVIPANLFKIDHFQIGHGMPAAPHLFVGRGAG